MLCCAFHSAQAALLLTQREGETLGLKLEDPSNSGRYRMLSEKAPDKEELAAKLQVSVNLITEVLFYYCDRR